MIISLIVLFESDIMDTSLIHCEHCYSCYALVIIHGNELVIFPVIALKSNDNFKCIVSSYFHILLS